MPGTGILPVPTRGFSVNILEGVLGFELETNFQGPRRKRMNCGPIRPRITETWLINGFSIPFLIAVGNAHSGEEGEATLEIPAVQMDIFDNNVLMYSTGLAAITAQNTLPGSSGSSQVGWGLLTADLTNPIALEAHSQLELGIRGIGPQRGPTSETVVEVGFNYSLAPGQSITGAITEILNAEAAGKSFGNGPGNFRYEAVDK